MPFDDPSANSTIRRRIAVAGVQLGPGDRVRLRPAGRADILDLALDGRTAVIDTIEQDLEDCIHLAVTIENDPVRDFGLMNTAAHRFFFRPDEIEPLAESERGGVAARAQILVAGIGNI